MLPRLPQTTVVCLMITIQCLIFFIFQILIGSLLPFKTVGWLVDRLWYTVPFTSASLCCWIVFIHSASVQLPACWRQSWPPCPGATPLPRSGCCRQEFSFFSCLRSFWSLPGMWGGHTCPLTTLPQPLLLRLILALQIYHSGWSISEYFTKQSSIKGRDYSTIKEQPTAWLL